MGSVWWKRTLPELITSCHLPVASCHLQLVTNIHLRASVVYSLEIEVFKFKVNFYDSGSLNPSSQYILVGRAVVWLPQPVQAVEEAV